MAKAKRISSERLYTVDEVADIFDVKPPTVRRWLKHKDMKGKKERFGKGLKKRWVVTGNEIIRFMNEELAEPE